MREIVRKRQEEGFAAVLVLTLAALIIIIGTTYAVVTVGNIKTGGSSRAASAGFYASEAALNARVEQVRQKFQGFLTPEGTTPTSNKPCVGTNIGTLDFICKTNIVGGRTVTSYVKRDAPGTIRIPTGERFAGLSAEETPFTVYGQALNSKQKPEAITALAFRSRLVPLFQFAVFFDKDLEFDNTAVMNLSGPVHTNGWLFLDAGSSSTLTLTGQVTSAENIYRGMKQSPSCNPGNVIINNAASTGVNSPACGARTQLTGAALDAYDGQLKDNIGRLEVPTVSALQPTIGATYWDKADARIVLKKTGTPAAPIWTPLFVTSSGATLLLNGASCAAALTTSQGLRDNREAQFWTTASATRLNRRTLDVDMRQLLACIQLNSGALGITGLNDVTDGGLVLYMTVDDSAASTVAGGLLSTPGAATANSISQTDPAVPNNYAVRLGNAATLRSSNLADPLLKGLTVVSDQAVFTQGDYNNQPNRAAGWVPAAILSDSVNVLSNNWGTTEVCRDRSNYYRNTSPTVAGINALATVPGVTSPTPAFELILGQNWYFFTNPAAGFVVNPAANPTSNRDIKSTLPLFCRTPSATTVKAAILAGTATTGAAEKTIYAAEPVKSGGVHNMTRFHEDWGNGAITFTYRGSLVSLNKPLHATGAFQLDQNIYYRPPSRQWSFETTFQDPAELPPLTPRFVYLKQDNFTRQFEQP